MGTVDPVPVTTAGELGRFIRDLRVQRGMTQGQLAQALGVTRQYVTEMETGRPLLYTDRLFASLRVLDGHLQATTATEDQATRTP